MEELDAKLESLILLVKELNSKIGSLEQRIDDLENDVRDSKLLQALESTLNAELDKRFSEFHFNRIAQPYDLGSGEQPSPPGNHIVETRYNWKKPSLFDR